MRLSPVLATAALLSAGAFVATGPASPAAAGDVCAGQTAHQNLSGAQRAVVSGEPVRSGPAAACNVRFRGSGATVDIHCYRISNGSVWWFVDTNLAEGVTDQQGWVFEGNLSSAPSRNQTGCQGPEFG